VREVPVGDFGSAGFYDARDHQRARDLAEEIRHSGEINPLIVAWDDKAEREGPYILEGGHRLAALQHLGAKSMPALVVVDHDSIPRSGVQKAVGVLKATMLVKAADVWRPGGVLANPYAGRHNAAHVQFADPRAARDPEHYQPYDRNGFPMGGLPKAPHYWLHPNSWYHGTRVEYERPRARGAAVDHYTGDANTVLGVHFASHPRTAEYFTSNSKGSRVIEARLHMRNPKHYDNEDDIVRDMLRAYIPHAERVPAMVDPESMNMGWNRQWLHSHTRQERERVAGHYLRSLRSQGYDGITYRNDEEPPQGQVSAIAIDPRQIEIVAEHRCDPEHQAFPWGRTD
jgi:hypothetical protein